MRKMEAKGRKMLALGVIAMMCAVAIIGIGYAAFAPGTAKTYNDNNRVESGYMTLTPQAGTVGAWDAITATDASALFDTYVYQREAATKTAFYLTAGETPTTVVADTVSYTATKVGTKTFVLDNQTGASIATLTMKVKQSVAVGNADFVYILTIGTVNHVLSSTTDGYATDFELTSVATGTTELEVSLYIGYVADVYLPVSDANGFKTGPAVTKAAYDEMSAGDKEKYDEAAKESASLAPADITDLDLSFIAGVWS